MRVTIFGQNWENYRCRLHRVAAAPDPSPLRILLLIGAASFLLVATGGAQDAPAKDSAKAAGTVPNQTVAPVQTPTPGPPAAQSAPDQAAAAAGVPPLSADEARRYVIGPDDGLSVTVWKEPTLSSNLAVRPDGMVSMPLVGDVPASGKTPMGLAEEITGRLKKFINDPLVTVSVLAVNSKHIFLLGEVGHVGQLPIMPGMTPLQAIAAAGGITPYANAKHIYILRTVSGKQEKIPFNYRKAIKDGNQQGVELVPGDTIVVP